MPQVKNPNVLEGMLAYISPEQTGRMNRSLDYRTDLYSLGVTLYELLTGRLPFTSTDPMEVIHGHIAKQPANPAGDQELTGLTVPLVLARIVLKLLAKNAEERYQSAEGLRADLDRCLVQVQDLTAATPDLAALNFPIGQEDHSGRFFIPEKLYGREAETERLVALFDLAVAGSKQVVFCAGQPGVGKSALIHELHKPILARRGYFISGKYDLFKRNLPYTAISQAFQDLVRQLLSEPETILAQRRAEMLQSVGRNGQVVLDVIPDLELILGPQPAVEVLAPDKAQNRFNLVFQEFVKRIAGDGHPLVLFLDDLQWADNASLHFIEMLLDNLQLKYFLFIGAYRDNEVGSGHSLALLLDKLWQQGIAGEQFSLGPLSEAHIPHMVADTLHYSIDEATTLAALIQAKTAGNPFFAREFLQTLYRDGLIEFTTGRWQYDLARIKQAGITNNVVELMARKIGQLPAPTWQILRLAACIGFEFSPDTLAAVLGKSQAEILVDLQPAFDEGLLIQIEDTVRFVHNRVGEAAHALIDPTERPTLHYRIGRVLLADYQREPREELIFTLADQLNQAQTLLSDVEEKKQLVEIDFKAGVKAKSSTAYDAAVGFFKNGATLLPASPWQTEYKTTLEFYIHWAEAAYLATHFDEAEQLFALILGQARTVLDRVKVYSRQIEYHATQGEFGRAVEVGRLALKQLGFGLPKKVTPLTALLSMAEVRIVLGWRKIPDLIQLPPMTDERVKAALDILRRVAATAYLFDLNLGLVLTTKMVILSLRYGNDLFSPAGYVNYGVALIIIGQVESGYQFLKLSIDIAEKYAIKNVLAITYCSMGSFAYYKESFANCLTYFQKAMEYCLVSGEVLYVGGVCLYVPRFMLLKGDKLGAAQSAYEYYTSIIDNLKLVKIKLYMNIIHQLVANLYGQITDPTKLSGDFFDEEETAANMVGDNIPLINYYSAKLTLAYLFEDLTDEADYLWAEKRIQPGTFKMITAFDYLFFYALAWAVLARKAMGSERAKCKQRVKRVWRIFKKWAKYCPENFLNKYHLITAELAEMEGKNNQAQHLYDQAIQIAAAQGFLRDTAIANECAARFYEARGLDKIAATYLREAHYGYQQWECQPKVTMLEKKYPFLRTQPTATSSLSSSSSHGAASLDLNTIIKASQTISGEIVLENLLRRMMTIIIENAGAQRGLLLLEQSGRWFIQARVEVEPEEIELLAAIPLETTSTVETLHATSLPFLSVSVVQYVIRTGQNVVLDDAAQNEHLIGRDYLLKKQPKSLLCLPLRNQAKVSGILYLENNLSVGAFTPDRLGVLNLLSAQMAVSLDNALLYNQMEELVAARTQQLQTTAQRLQTTAQRLQMVAHLSGQLNAILNLDRLLTELVNQVKEQFDFYHVHIYLLEGHVGPLPRPLPEAERGEDDLFSPSPGGELEGGYLAKPEVGRFSLQELEGNPILRLAAGYGEAGTEMKAEGHSIPLDAAISLVAQAARQHEVVRVDDVRQDPAWLSNPLLPHTRAEIAAPIIAEDQIIGVLDVQSDRVAGLDDGDADLLRSLANQVAVAITNARLFEQVGQAKEEAETAKQRAEIASRAKSEFLSSMSHELRTPLNGILGYAQILQRNKNLDTLQKEGLNIIRQSGDHLLTLINDILDLSKVEAGRLELYPNDFNFVDFLGGVAGLIRIRAQQKGLGFALEEIPPLPTAVCADEKRLRQILINLLTNAVKFTDNGHVTLRVSQRRKTEGGRRKEEKKPFIPHAKRSPFILFEVVDTGVGIDPDIVERIFLPFEQVGDVHKRAEGTGLGLSITRRLVELMGGRLQVDSQPGLGSAFWFEVELPLAQAATQPGVRRPSVRSITGYQGRRRKILIVDDKAHNRSVLLHLLTPLGFEILETDNAMEGIQLAQEHRPDLIIMDMVMPVMTGFEAVQQLRQLPEFKEALIFGASASVFEEEQRKVMLAGCNIFLPKPIEVKRLLDLIEEHLGLQWTYDDGETQVEPRATPSGELFPPPVTELKAVYDLARIGKIKPIREQATLWKSQNPAYGSFAEKIIDLARNFQNEQIMAFLEPYLGMKE